LVRIDVGTAGIVALILAIEHVHFGLSLISRSSGIETCDPVEIA
jgi:hypothetical protein